MRVRSRWHNKKKPKSLEELAGVLAFTAWKVGKETANKMYSAGFNFESNAQLLDVIGEFCAFLIQVADRMAHERGMGDEERARFVQTLAGQLVRTMVDNRTEELGEGDYAGPFIEMLNERLDGYAEYKFINGTPSYNFLRHLGLSVHAILGSDEGDNKWVTEQVMEVEAPELLKAFTKVFNDLFEQNEAAEAAAAEEGGGEE